uniref:Si:dkey-106g10.7 n=1 Tax=Pundamilia nyererei TaxID=303518 RepID=A0A3B4GK42_9CICH
MTRIHLHTLQAGIHFSTQRPNEHEGGADGQTTLGRWGPDHPLLLSLAPGPSGAKPRVQRASRPGLSRIPGRDHRRYYHEYWRSEYLMDFDPQRHGMICMVCGSSLATLKLSTIKRHIRQKHPDSLLWSAADKEVIRSGWESHLSLGGGQNENGAGEAPQPKEEEQYLPEPSAQILERYLNDSLHAWFRQEFLMEYESHAGRLLCMVCGAVLPSLHLDHIKSHLLDTHPNSLVYSSEEKHCILQAWTQTHGKKCDTSHCSDGADGGQSQRPSSPPFLDVETIQINTDVYTEGDGTFTQDTCLIGEDGGVGVPQQGLQPFRQPKKRRLHGGDPWRLRLDYLVAYGPQGQGMFCMVCSQVLHETKVSSFRRHIQECHPETTTLSRQEREAMAAAWTKDYPSEGMQIQDGEKENLWGPGSVKPGGSANRIACINIACLQLTVKTPLESDQRRNYQVRWRTDYLMDYDCRRHGLICMVCGATLATLKVSTIKRHVQQVHPHSLYFSAVEKQQALQSYNQTALHFIHSDDCFSPRDHGHTELKSNAICL